MNLDRVPTGDNAPDEFNVIIEIPAHSDPIKYEVDKESGAMFVDRFMVTSMHYPCNYGYIPHTISDDGDPCDVLVITPIPLITGSVITVRPIGVLMMEDEAGMDAKVLTVPINKLYSAYSTRKSHRDLPPELLDRIAHFFQHYKDLEEGKWVKITGWGDIDTAKAEVVSSIKSFQDAPVKPHF